MKIKHLTLLLLVTSLALSACGTTKKPNTLKPTPSPANTQLVLSPDQIPTIFLIPREDGHELTMKLENLPGNLSHIEYELLYSAADNGLEIEKGLGDTLKLSGEKIVERKLLLGTASCTTTCKYKYDEGITGGTLTVTLYTPDNQTISFELPFALLSSANFKKQGNISLKSENFTVKAKPSSTDFFLLIKNPKGGYSIYSSGSGKGVVGEISPSSFIKKDKNTISGEYLSP